MSRATVNSTIVDGLTVVVASESTPAMHPKCSIHSIESTTLNVSTNNGTFPIVAIVCWTASAFIVARGGNLNLTTISNLVLLMLYLITANHRAGLWKVATALNQGLPSTAFPRTCLSALPLLQDAVFFAKVSLEVFSPILTLSSLIRQIMSRQLRLIAMTALVATFPLAAAAPFTVDLSSFTPGVGARFIGSTASAYAGHDIAVIGDHNGDGFVDYAFTAPGLGKTIIVMKRNTTNMEKIVNNIVSGKFYRVIKAPGTLLAGSPVSGAGDINGDGFDDVLLGSRAANLTGSGAVGIAYVVFGQLGPFADLILTNSWTTYTTAFMIVGPATGVSFLSQARTARGLGDVNGDGIDDFAVSASDYQGTSAKTGAGVVWVIFGKTASDFTTIDLANFGSNGVSFTGAFAEDPLGLAIGAAGDFNGDGIADFLIGAPQYDPFVSGNTRTNAGVVYLIYGSETTLVTTDMSTFTTGSKGVRFLGAAVGDSLGQALSLVGDVNADGLVDIAIGAAFADVSSRSDCGIVYVIFGTQQVYFQDVDLLTFNDFTKGFKVYGSAINMNLASAAPAGDINGDGFPDLFVGGIGSESKAHVVFGQHGVRLAHVDTATDDVITFTSLSDGYLGWSIDGGEDLNGDSIPDILLSAYQAAVAPEGGGSAVMGAGVVWMIPGPIVFPVPSTAPVMASTMLPSAVPVMVPTSAPFRTFSLMTFTEPSLEPTAEPSAELTIAPTIAPTVVPTVEPTEDPVVPSALPSIVPSAIPSLVPSLMPSAVPSILPSVVPSIVPSVMPSAVPSILPSAVPSIVPSVMPSAVSSIPPSAVPSIVPSVIPSAVPSILPSAVPSMVPSAVPSRRTAYPTLQPTARPSYFFTGDLTKFTSDGDGARFIGATTSAKVGHDVAIIGDHNGDGFTDFIIGASGLNMAVILMKRNTSYTEVIVDSVVSGQYFRVIKGPVNSGTGQTVGGIGDINGDGFEDVIIGAAGGTAGTEYAFVIFGKQGPFTDLTVTASWAASSLGFMILGPPGNAEFVYRLRTARGLGDVNGDGIDDFAVSVRFYQSAGVVYVIFGKASTSFDTISLALANFGTNGIYFTGETSGDSFGFAINKVGDFNGDGIGDILVGACESHPVVNGVTRDIGGTAYLIYGSATTLVTTAMSTFVTGVKGVRFLGPEAGVYLGYAVGGVGDVNGDGLDDIAMGAPNARPFGHSLAGTVYIVYGTNVAYTADVDLFNYVASSKGFAIYGSANGVQLCTAAPAGDIDGDGVNDILVGGYQGSSKAHIVYGRVMRTSNVDTAVVIASNEVMTFTFSAGAYLGWSLDGGEDLNGDSIPDILLGAYTADIAPEGGGGTVTGAGAVWLLPGPFVLTNPTTAPTVQPTTDPTAVPTTMPSNPSAVPTARPSYVFTGDLTKFTSDGNGARFISTTANAYVGYDVAIIGDHNGDGFTDFIIGAPGLTKAVVVMTRNLSLSEIDVATIVSGHYFRVIIRPAGSIEGGAVGGIGDINGDSFDDVIVGASTGSVTGRSSAGYAFVIFGKAGPFTDLTVTVSWTASALGFQILGPQSGAYLIYEPHTARGLGDVNGDGIDDFAVSSRRYDGIMAEKNDAGVVYIIFGKNTTAFTTIDLLPANFGSNGVYYIGAASSDQLGYSVGPAGDFNNDGIADILIGSQGYTFVIDGVTRIEAGAVYLIYGSNTSLATTDMATFVTGSKGVRFLGSATGDNLGFGVGNVGDVNGDGIDDIGLGARCKDYFQHNNGMVYIIFGNADLYTEDVDMLYYGAFTKGFSIYGSFVNVLLNTVAPAGDINGDGVNDILVGGTHEISKAHIVFGQTAVRTAHVDTTFVIASNEVMTFSFDNAGCLGSAIDGGKDLNGDGIPDILLGAYKANIAPENGGTTVSSSGAVWLLPGPFILNNPTATPTLQPTTAPTAIPTTMPSNPSAVPTARPSYVFTGDLTKFTSDGDGVRFIGTTANAYVGYDVAIIGDHNSDGFTDFIIGAPGLSKAIIVMTKNRSLSEIDLATVVSGQYYRVIVAPTGSMTRGAIGGIGDINGDSFDDMIVGGSTGSVIGRTVSGYAFVIFGKQGPFIDLAVTASWAASEIGFQILGPEGHAYIIYEPHTARGLGDVNGDGIDDFAVSSCRYDGIVAEKLDAGVVYVIFGKNTTAFTTIDLLPANFGSNGVYFIGPSVNSLFGYSVSAAGDFNNDGFADLLVGCYGYDRVVDTVTTTDVGAVYLIYGSNTTLATTDMATFATGNKGVRFIGTATDDQLGFGVGNVGDVNGDGIDDIGLG